MLRGICAFPHTQERKTIKIRVGLGRARVVFNEGRTAGADKWLFMSSAAQAADQRPTDLQSTDSR
jgi:hypothetical protein